MKQIPKYLHSLFWDVRIEIFDPLKHPRYTISRILELGDTKAVEWMKKAFSQMQIEKTIKEDKKLSPKSANFWAIIFGIPFNDVASLKNKQVKKK